MSESVREQIKGWRNDAKQMAEDADSDRRRHYNEGQQDALNAVLHLLPMLAEVEGTLEREFGDDDWFRIEPDEYLEGDFKHGQSVTILVLSRESDA